jgi:cytoskeleton protein RodZ
VLGNIGEALKNARLEKGFTFEQIENDTKIQRRYLEAMENEQWEILPGQVYLKSFFRTYSRYLGLSETYYYQLMNEQITRPSPKHNKKRVRINISAQTKMRIVLTLLAIFFLVGTSYYYQQYLALPEFPEVIDNIPVGNENEENNPLPGQEGEEQDNSTAPPAIVEAMTLTLKCVNSPCWVRVQDGNQKTIYEGTMKVEEELEFKDLQKFTLRLGFAQSIRAKINGIDVGPLGEMVVTKTFVLENNEVREEIAEEEQETEQAEEQKSPQQGEPKKPQSPEKPIEPNQPSEEESEETEEPAQPEQPEQPSAGDILPSHPEQTEPEQTDPEQSEQSEQPEQEETAGDNELSSEFQPY